MESAAPSPETSKDAGEDRCWIEAAHAVQNALNKSEWRKSAASPVDWLKAYSSETGYSTNTLRRLGQLLVFGNKLIEKKIITDIKVLESLSHTKLEIVSRIWEIKPDEAYSLVKGMLAKNAPKLRKLRDRLAEIRGEENLHVRPRGIAQIVARREVSEVLKALNSVDEVVTHPAFIAVPSSRAFELVTVDAVVGRALENSNEFSVEAGIVVLRSNEVTNRQTFINFLAKISYISKFFKAVWIAGEHKNFLSLSPKDQGDTDQISNLISYISRIEIENIGMVECKTHNASTEKMPESLKHSGILKEPKIGRSKSLIRPLGFFEKLEVKSRE